MSHPDLNRLRNQIRKVEAEKKKANQKMERVLWGILIISLVTIVFVFLNVVP
ncbi:hypothetical protein ACWM35_11035 [Neobacillus sp. K501]